MIKTDYINLNYDKEELNTSLELYLKFLIISGLFYITPSFQFVMFQSNNVVNCYYNFKCKYAWSFIPAFNNIISNLLYIIYGLVYIIIVRFKRGNLYELKDLGIYRNKSLYYSLGLCLIFEGISSSLYHICPSRLNLQFDTTFMFIGILYSYLTLYNKRHTGDLCNPLKFYILVFMLIILNILSLRNTSTTTHIWFWSLIFLITSYCLVFTSIYIYSRQMYDFDLKSLRIFIDLIRNDNLIRNPKFWLILFSNSFTLGMLVYASFFKPYFTGWLLCIGIVNLSIYFIYYLITKVINKEKIRPFIFWLILLDLILLVISLYFYTNTDYDTFVSIHDSNKLNRECVLFNYFDNHDIWHFMSSTTLFVFVIIVLFIDYDLEYSREEIIESV